MSRKRLRDDLERDPVVEEIRAIRQKMWQEAGGTLEGYIAMFGSRSRTKRKAIRNSSRAPRAGQAQTDSQRARRRKSA